VEERYGQRTTGTLEDKEHSDALSCGGGSRLQLPQLQGCRFIPGFGSLYRDAKFSLIYNV